MPFTVTVRQIVLIVSVSVVKVLDADTRSSDDRRLRTQEPSWRLRGDEMLGESPASSSDCAISVEILMFAFVLHVQAIKTTGACH